MLITNCTHVCSRFKLERDDEDSEAPPTAPPTSTAAAAADRGTVTNIGISPSEIQQLLASTKKQIEDRKKQTQSLLAQGGIPPAGPSLLPTPPNDAPLRLNQTPEYYHNLMAETIEKARKAAEVREGGNPEGERMWCSQ